MSPSAGIVLRVSIVNGRGRSLGRRDLSAWLEQVVGNRAAGEVAIALVSDATIRRLNRTFRHVDLVTDVLSFPSADDPIGAARRPRRPSISTDRRHLGDIAIGLGRALRQARAQGHSLATELRILALHGFLHLIGYDHDRDRGEMARVERRLRRAGGLPQGLTERKGPA